MLIKKIFKRDHKWNFTLFKEILSRFILIQRYCNLCSYPDQNIICANCLKHLAQISNDSCAKCKNLKHNNESWCTDCSNGLTHFNHLYCLYLYQPPISQFIQKLKYDHQINCSKVLSYLMWQNIKSIATTIDLLIPIPLNSTRIKERGFNQVLELLYYYQLYCGNSHIALNHVIRNKNTNHQTNLIKEQRINNLKNAFIIQKSVKNLRIAIVDDVVTTGATVNELAQLLMNHGAKQVDVWCLARAQL